MTDFKREKKVYSRSFVVTGEEVFEEILLCDTLGWSWCESKIAVHHTAIVYYLDGKPKYTANWTPKNGTKAKSVLLEVEGQLVYEDETLKGLGPDDVKYHPSIQTYDVVAILHSEDDKAVDNFLDFIDKLSRFQFSKYENKDAFGNALKYDVSSCNCRDHVLSVLHEILPAGETLSRLTKEVQRVRWERIPEVILYTFARFRGLFTLLLGMILPTGVDIGKALAKYVSPDCEKLERSISEVRAFLSSSS